MPWRLLLLPLSLLIAALIIVGVADAHLVRTPDHPKKSKLENRLAQQEENLRHARYVARRGRGENQTWHRVWIPLLVREIRETRLALRTPAPARVYSTGDACLDEIIDRETVGTWDPGIWNYQGSGAFGLPQALPFTKLPKAGWPKEYGGQEDPHAQIEWMRDYVDDRYGGSCGALAFHNANGWY